MLDFTLNLLLRLAGAGKKTVVETPHLQKGLTAKTRLPGLSESRAITFWRPAGRQNKRAAILISLR